MLLKRFVDRIQRNKDIVTYLREKGVKIGEGCEIYSVESFGSEPYLVEIGNNVRINSGVSLVTHDGGVWVLRNLNPAFKEADLFGKIIIHDNVHIGTNAIIMPNVEIGSNCIIGCGAIVTHDIPDNSIAVGVPARVIESIDEYIKKHEKSLVMTKGLSAIAKRNYLLEVMNTNK